MKHLAAYLLLKLGGNESPSSDDVINVLSEVGIEVESDRLDQLISNLEGKDLKTVMEEGKDMLASFGGGGGGSGGGAAAGGDGEAAAEVEEEVVVEEEEMDLGGGMDMFGGEEKGDGDY